MRVPTTPLPLTLSLVCLGIATAAAACPCAQPPVRVVAEVPVVAEIELGVAEATPEMIERFHATMPVPERAPAELGDPAQPPPAPDPFEPRAGGQPVRIHRILSGDMGFAAPVDLVVTFGIFECFRTVRHQRMVAMLSPWGRDGWIVTWLDLPSLPGEAAKLGLTVARSIACQQRALAELEPGKTWSPHDRLFPACWLDALALGAGFPEDEVRRDPELLADHEREGLVQALLARRNLDQIGLLMSLTRVTAGGARSELALYLAEVNALDFASANPARRHHLYELLAVLDDEETMDVLLEIDQSRDPLPLLREAWRSIQVRHQLAPRPTAATRAGWQRYEEVNPRG